MTSTIGEEKAPQPALSSETSYNDSQLVSVEAAILTAENVRTSVLRCTCLLVFPETIFLIVAWRTELTVSPASTLSNVAS